MIWIAFDVGGTFTDIVLYDAATHRTHVTKVPTLPPQPAAGVVEGIQELLDGIGRTTRDITRVLYGTTLATNTLVERNGARVGLITTAGFRDVLELARSDRGEDVFNLFFQKPKPLVERHLRREVQERVDARGQVLVPLDRDEVARVAGELMSAGAEVLAVALINSFVNNTHEEEIGSLVRTTWPGVGCSLSTEISREYGEWERTSTAVLNAYVMPRMGGHFRELRRQLSAAGITAPVEVVQSNGGVVPAVVADRLPVRLFASGPAAGVAGAAAAGALAGFLDLISFDMGGTSTDVGIVQGGQPAYRPEGTVEGYFLRTIMVDVRSIGAGGGSIVRLDPTGSLAVGPESAGSDPGPACYLGGGEHPTITDADLVLGYLNPDRFWAGRRRLDVPAAERALAKHVAAPKAVSVIEAALGSISVAVTQMVRAVRQMTTERGLDPRDFTLVAFGGAGPLHAAAVAAELQIPRVLVPADPGLQSAQGALIAATMTDVSCTFVRPLPAVEAGEVDGAIVSLEDQALAVLSAGGHSPGQYEVERVAEMCYQGQDLHLPIPVPAGPITPAVLSELAERLDRRFRELYGFLPENRVPQFYNLRVLIRDAAGERPRAVARPAPPAAASAEPALVRRVYFPSVPEGCPCPVYGREAILVGVRLEGPCVVEEDFSTTLVYPGQSVVRHAAGHLIIELP